MSIGFGRFDRNLRTGPCRSELIVSRETRCAPIPRRVPIAPAEDTPAKMRG